MSVLAKVREMIAGLADGHHKALEHVASEVDSLKSTGVPKADLDAIAEKFDGKVMAFLDHLDEQLKGRVGALEKSVQELQGKVLAQAAEAPAPEAQANAAANGSAAEEQKAAPADVTDGGAPLAQ